MLRSYGNASFKRRQERSTANRRNDGNNSTGSKEAAEH